MRNPFLQEEKQIRRRDRRSDAAYQREVENLVERTVIYGVSAVVFEIGKVKHDEWFHLFVREDWETPAREAIPDLPREKLLEFLASSDCAASADDSTPALANDLSRHIEEADGWQEFCAAHDLEPHRTEIYEHWIVSDWLADRFEERGEVIERDFYGLTIWGRACTGQAILLDEAFARFMTSFTRRRKPTALRN